MPLPYKVKDLETVPESARELYEKKGDEFVLQVEGVEAAESVGELRRALERVRGERDTFKRRADSVKDEDLTELEALRKEKLERDENKLKDAGRWEDLRARLQQEHATAMEGLQAQIDSRNRVIETLTVTNELRAALDAAGIQPEYREAAEALLEKRQPKVVWDGETPKGVFPDEVHGDQPIAGYVESWAKGDDAKKFLPVPTKPGGGAPGTEGKGGAPGGKNWAEMTPDEKVAYTGEKYGAGAETGATA